MPRVPDLPCNRCGKMLWRGTTSLPDGRARCQPCRRVEPNVALSTRECARCGDAFQCKRSSTTTYCSRTCYARADGERRRIRSADDSRVRRWQRDRDAPGLSQKARALILKQWKQQGKTCAYCPRPADTVDHALPLVRGGTSFEGNLAPCCKSCNSSKSGHTVIEWRTGLRLRPMDGTLAGRPKAERRRPKPKPERPPRWCRQCSEQITDTNRKAYCSVVCAKQANTDTMRDYMRRSYRVRVGIPVDAPLHSRAN